MISVTGVPFVLRSTAYFIRRLTKGKPVAMGRRTAILWLRG
jgi:hypothetical protein